MVCNNCLNGTKFVYTPFCICCQKPSIEGKTHITCLTKYKPVSLITPFYYTGLVKQILVKSKYYSKQYQLLKDLVYYIFQFNEQFNLHLLNNFVVSYIPPDKVRLKQRGYSPSKTIATILAKHLNLPLTSTLVKVKSTPTLTMQKKYKRQQAVKGVYLCTGNVNNKNILLVDDVLTTGSTLLEATKQLKKAGAKQVICFALSYRPINNSTA